MQIDPSSPSGYVFEYSVKRIDYSAISQDEKKPAREKRMKYYDELPKALREIVQIGAKRGHTLKNVVEAFEKLGTVAATLDYLKSCPDFYLGEIPVTALHGGKARFFFQIPAIPAKPKARQVLSIDDLI